MAEEPTPTETTEATVEDEIVESPAQDMELEVPNPTDSTNAGGSDASTDNGVSEPNLNRTREEKDEGEEIENGGDDDGAKRQKIDKSVEEERLEKLGGEVNTRDDLGPVKVGPKTFESSVEMFEYFHKFLHYWTPNLNVNKYEHMMLLELIKKGHQEPERKIGEGIHAFQVRFHPLFKSRCFFLIREDESVDDFSFRKCVDHILPLPESMQIKDDVNKILGGGGRGGRYGRGGGYSRGRGRRGRSRN